MNRCAFHDWREVVGVGIVTVRCACCHARICIRGVKRDGSLDVHVLDEGRYRLLPADVMEFVYKFVSWALTPEDGYPRRRRRTPRAA